MTLDQLRVIVEVSRKGTISAAAKSLHISHPAISRAISNLEQELNVNIFIRGRAGTTVTEVGEEIIASAEKILNEISFIQEITNQTSKKKIISVAAFSIETMPFLVGVIQDFQEQYSQAVISMYQASVSEIIMKLHAQQVDFGIMCLPVAEKRVLSDDILTIPLFDSRLSILCCGDAPLSSYDSVTPEEVMNYPIILQDDPIILNILKKIFGEDMKDILMYANNNSLIKKVVLMGSAYGIYTSFLAESEPKIAQKELCLIPLDSDRQEAAELLHFQYMLLYNKKKQFSQADKRFIKLLKNHTSKWK